ncbi:MAG: DUF421 domain-containing protein [Clostridiales bacterium]|nr:DUF421 domain-containing protein [Clostridiales bacterium]
MEFLETVFILFYRTVLFFSVLMLALRIMGKRQLGDAEPSDLVVTILLSELAAGPLQNIEEPIYRSLVPIILLVVIELTVAFISLKNVNLRRFFQGRYSILIDDGKINQAEMKKAHVTIDEVLEEIRQSGGIGVDEVRYCILETSGKMSVIMKDNTAPIKLPISIILDGKIIYRNLSSCGLSRKGVKALLEEKGIRGNDIFWMYYSEGEIKTIMKDEKS